MKDQFTVALTLRRRSLHDCELIRAELADQQAAINGRVIIIHLSILDNPQRPANRTQTIVEPILLLGLYAVIQVRQPGFIDVARKGIAHHILHTCVAPHAELHRAR